MKQYNAIKAKYPDAILLFRVGDFYETFGPDAVTAASVLGITLTKRNNGAAGKIDLAGFPHHALDTYLPKLVRAGYRAAICEQLEDPKMTKTIVKRGVTELVTPGVALSDKILNHKTNNYLASVHFNKRTVGLSFADISTGEFLVTQGSADYIDKLLQSFQPSEVIYSKNYSDDFKEHFGDKFYTYPLEDWVFKTDFTRELLLRHFQTKTLKGFGVESLDVGNVAAGSIIHYLGTTEHANLQHFTALGRLKQDKYVWLDRFTIRNLELLNSPFDGGTPLIKVLDQTISPMGSRLLRKWIALPLKNSRAIENRHSMVEYFMKQEEFKEQMIHHIQQIGDIERLIAKVPMGKITPRQVAQLKKALFAIEPIQKLCSEASNEILNRMGEQLNPCKIIRSKIETELIEEPPVALNKGSVIREGVSEELDELRRLTKTSKDYLLEIQQREIEATGITSLKISFNNVFGYYLEVRNRFKAQVPKEWIRKQTLVSSERYITQELKTYEEKILGAEEKILALESQLFEALVASLNTYIRPIQLNAALIAQLDCLLSFARASIRNNYHKPQINDSLILDIKAGRHPVIEQQMAIGEEYVPNDIYLDSESQQLLIITGPNMAGKSALLRQAALIVIMAQMGCFVPAAVAKLGITDKVFTRVGASDNISSGESTFMVEMNETASIMNNISERSLILLDEIGRGTSTYDGISIAWALAEYLHNHPKAQPKTLFATHYHELTELSNKFDRIKNYHISTKEIGNKVIFLRKLVPGGALRSFGIHVAQMAGMPKQILKRANEILAQLEDKGLASDQISTQLKQMPEASPYQLNIFEVNNPKMKKLEELLSKLDVNTMTPIEALLKLNELKKAMEEE